jgi:hypothetical protein
MHGLPEGFKTDFLCERTLDLICFTRYQVYFHLSRECLISVEGEISLDQSGRLSLPTSLSDIYPLIDQRITAASGRADGRLSLVFEKGQTLFIYDSSEQFESYSISDHGTVLVRV